ncbi:MAG: double-strand break repair helicase AddA [Alphaproteobacteria bacterium]|jgi:ATP-dependent helicase/nuclease subunit A|nr:double-strand break repair helicase AddA [Alphaproteobacteria bacterium]
MTSIKDIQKIANDSQAQASNPMSSVWVSASAGSGKTKVLRDRVLRLLLTGVSPHKIVCLTFTKAAASEMASRINNTLQEWSIMPDKDLRKELIKLPINQTISDEIMSKARELFAIILDSPLNIQNLHSFCQKILKRFPLESEVSPHFEVIDEVNSDLILQNSISKAIKNKDIQEDIKRILSVISEKDFEKLTKNITSNKNKLFEVLKKYREDIFSELYNFWQVDESTSEEKICADFLKQFSNNDLIESVLKEAGGKRAISCLNLFELYKDNSVPVEIRFDKYKNIFISNSTLKPNGNHIKIFEKAEQSDIFSYEANRCIDTIEKIKNLKLYKLNKSFLHLSLEIVNTYSEQKESLSVLDFDDLIFKALSLLKKSDINPWVMFKLDGGISHILVDEAQDTSPDLWEIIDRLTDEFFVGSSTEDIIQKTLFVVGDEKQSIYSFQGADLKLFQEKKTFFKKKIKHAGNSFEEVPMSVSFRSLPGVLKFVDEVFKNNEEGIAKETIEHTAFKENSPGYIEVWDHIENDKDNNLKAFEISVKKMVSKIRDLLDSKDILPATNKPISPADIMILLSSRKTNFLNLLYRELKAKSIPVEGADKFYLQKELLVDDFVSLIKFLLLPSDDLSLAELLKTPLINISEEDLFELAYNRNKETLWSRLLKSSKHKNTVNYLTNLLKKVDFIRPYDFINYILISPCPNDDISGKRAFIKHIGEHVKETIDELLIFSINFEKLNIISMQNFLHELINSSIEIKREFEKSTKVKVMTIHGSKGLESPIVFLPDTTKSSTFMGKERVFWNRDFPIWLPKKEMMSDISEDAYNEVRKLKIEEHKRLLYVALTRAEDRLYISSYGEKHIAESWRYKLYDSIKSIGNSIEGGYCYGNTTYDLDKSKSELKDKKIMAYEIKNKDFIFKEIENEDMEETPKTPSLLEENISVSPFKNNDSIFFKRGLIIHKLLEILPNTSNKELACSDFLKNSKHGLSQEQILQIKTEIMSIFNNYSYLFSENSFAEVPIVGEINGEKYSGVIDRLCIKEDEIIIVDYKSNRPPAETAEDTPNSYKKQLEIYKGILSKVYPNKNIKTAILWTNTSKLIFLNQA